MKLIAIDPGLTSGVARYDKGNITTMVVELDKDAIRLFMAKNGDCPTWIVEKPVAYNSLAAEVEMCCGYWYAAIDFLSSDPSIYNQFPKERQAYMSLAKKFAYNPHTIDATAHLLKYLDKHYRQEYNGIILSLEGGVS